MKRALIALGIVVFVAGGALAAFGAGDSATGKEYKVVFDSAFGLVKGADFKVGGVPVGSIQDLDVDRKDARAIVTVGVSQGGKGFGGLRDSATCTVNPQSLIGEYFVDCQPGKTGKLLKTGATIPVKRTTSPIPPDLVLNVMRMPVAQRFSIIFSELGAGFAARGDDINETIRRAVPALQTTDEVLKLLARNRRTLASLARDSGTVLEVLGERREDVGDFVVEAENAASVTADRRDEVAETFRRFPGFLDQLTPTMRDLGTAAREQAPALADLRAAAPSVTSLLNTLRPFSQASLPAVTSLGDASESGRTASREAASLVGRLGDLGAMSPEPSKNLRIILDHLDDRRNAVERDPESPTGAGYTGLEAPLQYVFDQSLAINVFDQRGYTLKLNLTTNECSEYATAQDVTKDAAARAKYERCNQNLGPNQPGITTADPSPPATRRFSAQGGRNARRGSGGAGGGGGSGPSAPNALAPGATPAPDAPSPAPLAIKPLKQLIDELPKLVDPLTGKLKPGKLPLGRGSSATSPAAAQDLLDFLLRP